MTQVNVRTNASSTLGEISIALKSFFFQCLESKLPTVFDSSKDPDQVLVCPSASLESDFHMRSVRRANEGKDGVVLPFAAVSRLDLVEDTFFRRARLYTVVDYTTGTDSKVFKLFNVQLNFSMRVYVERYDQAESIIEKILFLAKNNQQMTYHSEILGVDVSATILLDSPEYTQIPEASQLYGGAGSIYVVTVPVRVSAPIGERGPDSKIILHIDGDIYARKKSEVSPLDTPDVEINIESTS